MLDPTRATALELAQALRRGETTSEALVRAALARIDAHNPRLQAFVHLQPRRALRDARAKDAERRQAASPDDLPVFHGVPMGIKDLVPVRGTPTRLGARPWRYFVSPIDGEVAKRLKAGGFVILGKLATSEFGAMPVTEPDIHAPTRNPWNVGHSSGGSSGGSSAAVAAGLLPAAHGSDGGGSVRIPAAFTHLYGFKPSAMLLGNLHGAVNQLGLSTMGPLTHTVADAAAMLDVMRGHTHRLSATRSLSSRAEGPVRPRRIAMVLDPPFGETDPAVRAAVERTAALLEDLGHHVEPVDGVRIDLQTFLPIWYYQVAQVPCPSESRLQPITRWLRARGREQSPDRIHALQRDLCERLAATLGDADMVLSPTVPHPAPPVGAYHGRPPAEAFADASSCGAFTAGFNLTGQPAANHPAGLHPDSGLPMGVQLAGRVDHDAEVLAVSRQLEQAMSWRHRRAPDFL